MFKLTFKIFLWALISVGEVSMAMAFQSGDFLYSTNDNVATITNYAGAGGIVTIPATLDGFPVKSIGNKAFYARATITSIAIPDGITNIGNYAFSYCDNLGNVVVPDSVTRMGVGAFANCYNLADAIIGNGVTRLETDTIGNNWGAFQGCRNMTNVLIGSSVTNIESSAFLLCTNLPNVTIPDNVTYVGDAFALCSRLTNITIGVGLANIVLDTLVSCRRLMTISVAAQNSFYSSVDGVLFDKNLKTLLLYPQARMGSYTIPQGVTNIASFGFNRSTYLFSVRIPDSVTWIGVGSFLDCSNLTSVYFEGNAPAIGSQVFSGTWFNYVSIATIYYLPETTGWGATYGGRPTMPWKPEMQADDNKFGVQTNQFGFNINWASDRTVIVEACADLGDPIWHPVSTNNLPGGISYFCDPQWADYSSRFYRLRSP